ncbi:MAG: ABC transporter substrate-binding protein [Gammaproteobacteria bacterium]|nr:ABC transporter substrate-binding protein [Gammaproteobacteria bacterium]
MRLLKFLFSIFCLASSYSILAASNPLPMVIKMNQDVIEVLKKNQAKLQQNPHIIEKAITAYFLPHVDTLGMSRSVLGRNAWVAATPAEKTAFTQEFTQLVLRTYAQPLAAYNGEKVEFMPIRDKNLQRFTQVQTIIVRTNGQRIPMVYHLVFGNDGQWRVYDLSVEGVSLLNSFRNQFGQALRDHELKAVINRMHEKNQQRVLS